MCPHINKAECNCQSRVHEIVEPIIEVEQTNTGFFKLFVHGQYIGTYGNPIKALHMAEDMFGMFTSEDKV